MPLIVLDTNILMADFPITGSVRQLITVSGKCGISIHIPEIVADELKGNFRQRVQAAQQKLESESDKLERLGVYIKVPALDLGKQVTAYLDRFHSIISEEGIRIEPYPPVTIKDVVGASYEGKKPFKDTGEGHKDYTIFQTILGIVKKSGEDVWFVTNNRKDFCGKDNELHPDLAAQVPLGHKVEIFSSARNITDQVLNPKLKKLDRIAKDIRAGKFKDFDLEGETEAIFIEELCDKSYVIEGANVPLNDPTALAVGDHEVEELEVRRLDEELLLIELSGYVDLELFGFIEKNTYYLSGEGELDDIHIDNADWNDHVMSATAIERLNFEMSVIFDEKRKEIESVSLEISSIEDM